MQQAERNCGFSSQCIRCIEHRIAFYAFRMDSHARGMPINLGKASPQFHAPLVCIILFDCSSRLPDCHVPLNLSPFCPCPQPSPPSRSSRHRPLQDSSEAPTWVAPVAPSVLWGLRPWARLLEATVWAVFQATAAAVVVVAAVAEAEAATCQQIGARGCWSGFHSREVISWEEGRVLSPHRSVGGVVVSWGEAAELELAAVVEGTGG
jgi:hypothetical protein